MLNLPISLLDLAVVPDGESIGVALHNSVDLAQTAELHGYTRVWYAEHHNMATIASSATAVLIAHVAANTSSIRLGAGGVMLPNHSPLVIAEQFGTLAELHPNRIDLGLGRAPGTDMATFRAMRKSPNASESFSTDVQELQELLGTSRTRTEVNAYPGRGTQVPLYVLGSSMFGASLAAHLGLPYAFASHFAPQLLTNAIAYYRENYQPSQSHPEPYAIAAVNVVAAQSDSAADELFARAELSRVKQFLSRGRAEDLSDSEALALIDSPAGVEIRKMFTHTASGGPDRIRNQLIQFADLSGADELMTIHVAPTHEERKASVQLTSPLSTDGA